MSNLTVKIPHTLGRAEVKRRIQDRLRTLKEQPNGVLANIQDSWHEDKLEFKLWALGQSISGHLLVEESAVDLEVQLPWMFSMLTNPIKRQIEQNLQPLLAAPKR